jgi:hypothetical protein
MDPETSQEPAIGPYPELFWIQSISSYSCFWSFSSILSSHPHLVFPNYLSSSRFLSKYFHTFLIYVTRTTCPANFTFLGLIIIMIFDDEQTYKLWTSLFLFVLLLLSVFSSASCIHTPLTDVLPLGRDWVRCSHKTTDNITGCNRYRTLNRNLHYI